MKKLYKLGIFIVALWATKHFILSNINIGLVNPAGVTTIICACIILVAVVVSLLIKGE